jgi:hypothetical protein
MTVLEAEKTGAKPATPAKPASKRKAHPRHPAERYIVLTAVGVAVVLAIGLVGAFKWFDHERALDARENTRATAEQVLRARVTDASISPPIQIQKVEWKGEDLAISYVQGDKSCIGKVILPVDGQQYGIAKIDKVAPEQRADKQYYCSTVSSADGLSPAGIATTTAPPKK